MSHNLHLLPSGANLKSERESQLRSYESGIGKAIYDWAEGRAKLTPSEKKKLLWHSLPNALEIAAAWGIPPSPYIYGVYGLLQNQHATGLNKPEQVVDSAQFVHSLTGFSRIYQSTQSIPQTSSQDLIEEFLCRMEGSTPNQNGIAEPQGLRVRSPETVSELVSITESGPRDDLRGKRKRQLTTDSEDLPPPQRRRPDIKAEPDDDDVLLSSPRVHPSDPSLPAAHPPTSAAAPSQVRFPSPTAAHLGHVSPPNGSSDALVRSSATVARARLRDFFAAKTEEEDLAFSTLKEETDDDQNVLSRNPLRPLGPQNPACARCLQRKVEGYGPIDCRCSKVGQTACDQCRRVKQRCSRVQENQAELKRVREEHHAEIKRVKAEQRAMSIVPRGKSQPRAKSVAGTGAVEPEKVKSRQKRKTSTKIASTVGGHECEFKATVEAQTVELEFQNREIESLKALVQEIQTRPTTDSGKFRESLDSFESRLADLEDCIDPAFNFLSFQNRIRALEEREAQLQSRLQVLESTSQLHNTQRTSPYASNRPSVDAILAGARSPSGRYLMPGTNDSKGVSPNQTIGSIPSPSNLQPPPPPPPAARISPQAILNAFVSSGVTQKCDQGQGDQGTHGVDNPQHAEHHMDQYINYNAGSSKSASLSTVSVSNIQVTTSNGETPTLLPVDNADSGLHPMDDLPAPAVFPPGTSGTHSDVEVAKMESEQMVQGADSMGMRDGQDQSTSEIQGSLPVVVAENVPVNTADGQNPSQANIRASLSPPISSHSLQTIVHSAESVNATDGQDLPLVEVQGSLSALVSPHSPSTGFSNAVNATEGQDTCSAEIHGSLPPTTLPCASQGDVDMADPVDAIDGLEGDADRMDSGEAVELSSPALHLQLVGIVDGSETLTTSGNTTQDDPALTKRDTSSGDAVSSLSALVSPPEAMEAALDLHIEGKQVVPNAELKDPTPPPPPPVADPISSTRSPPPTEPGEPLQLLVEEVALDLCMEGKQIVPNAELEDPTPPSSPPVADPISSTRSPPPAEPGEPLQSVVEEAHVGETNTNIYNEIGIGEVETGASAQTVLEKRGDADAPSPQPSERSGDVQSLVSPLSTMPVTPSRKLGRARNVGMSAERPNTRLRSRSTSVEPPRVIRPAPTKTHLGVSGLSPVKESSPLRRHR